MFSSTLHTTGICISKWHIFFCSLCHNLLSINHSSGLSVFQNKEHHISFRKANRSRFTDICRIRPRQEESKEGFLPSDKHQPKSKFLLGKASDKQVLCKPRISRKIILRQIMTYQVIYHMDTKHKEIVPANSCYVVGH